MGEFLGNVGGVIKRGDLYYNDSGTLKTIEDFNVFTNNNGEIVFFPQKEACVLNFDRLTWCSNSLESASSFIKKTDPTFSTKQTSQTSFGALVDSEVTSGSDFNVCNNKYWFIPSNSYRNDLGFGENILSGGAFTIALTYKQFGTPTNWRNLTWFNNSDGLRFEWNSAGLLSVFGENNLLSGDMNLPQLSSYRDNWVQIILVVNGNSIKAYQNGVLAVERTLTRTLLTTNGNMIRLFSQRGSANGSYGCPVAIRDFSLWKTALTEQEITDLRKWLFLD